MPVLRFRDIPEKIFALRKDNPLIIGIGNLDYAISLEGSLKLKEISYMHSEAYAAVLIGCDVDQPRNLSKSVTVE